MWERVKWKEMEKMFTHSVKTANVRIFWETISGHFSVFGSRFERMETEQTVERNDTKKPKQHMLSVLLLFLLLESLDSTKTCLLLVPLIELVHEINLRPD